MGTGRRFFLIPEQLSDRSKSRAEKQARWRKNCSESVRQKIRQYDANRKMEERLRLENLKTGARIRKQVSRLKKTLPKERTDRLQMLQHLAKSENLTLVTDETDIRSDAKCCQKQLRNLA